MAIDETKVLYEDNHIIVVIKDENILSQGDITNDENMVDNLKEYLKVKYNKPGNVFVGLVHRLDRRVSGVMVFSKTSKAASRLSESIRSNQFKKKYIAVVDGCLSGSDKLVNKLSKKDGVPWNRRGCAASCPRRPLRPARNYRRRSQHRPARPSPQLP